MRGRAFFGGAVALGLLLIASEAHANLSCALPGLSVEAGQWAAIGEDGVIATEWVPPGGREFSFAMIENKPHFELRFSAPDFSYAGTEFAVSDGDNFKLTLSFDNGQTLELTAEASGGTAAVLLPNSMVAGWTHNLTANHTLTVRGLPDGTWTIPLNGTTTTVTTMATAISFAGVKGLSAPFNTPMLNIMGSPAPDIYDWGGASWTQLPKSRIPYGRS